jgi:hypothetical protein
MPFREKHIDDYQETIKSFIDRKNLKGLLSAVVFLFILSHGFASGKEIGKVYTSGDAIVVYSASNSGDVIITSGKITIPEGETIHLLPGTHIKSSEQLTINIASRECQDAVAREVAREKEERMLAYAAERRREALMFTTVEELYVPFNYSQLPAQNRTIGPQRPELTASLVTTTVSFAAPVSLLNKKISLSDNNNLQVTNDLWLYTPIYSWGERAENIMVMLC